MKNDPKPSFIAKIDWAEEHLLKLEAEVALYICRRPYRVSTSKENRGGREVHRLSFTEQVPSQVTLLAADFIYNLRSGLEHLAAALVPGKNHRSSGFPIFWQGVWESEVPGENEQRTKDRQRWNTYTREMHPEAVAILKTLQPPDEHSHKRLAVLNRLSNRDRHSRFVIISQGLTDAIGTYRLGDTVVRRLESGYGQGRWTMDSAEILVPDGAVDVHITGTPLVTLHVDANHVYPIPDEFRGVLDFVRWGVCEQLAPYVR